MELVKTIRGFHWVTKIVIALTILLVGLLLAAMVSAIYWTSSHQNNQAALDASQGFGMMAMSLSWVLTQVFLVVLIIIAIYMAIMAVKSWIEKYLNAILADREADRAALALMNEKFSQVEQKLDRIETILEKVGE